MKVIILKSKNSKSIIGFTEQFKSFVDEWLLSRSQYHNLSFINDNKAYFEYKDEIPNSSNTFVIYASELRDGETCWISCDDNLMGFNDNH